jgi:hypothetical protein
VSPGLHSDRPGRFTPGTHSLLLTTRLSQGYERHEITQTPKASETLITAAFIISCTTDSHCIRLPLDNQDTPGIPSSRLSFPPLFRRAGKAESRHELLPFFGGGVGVSHDRGTYPPTTLKQPRGSKIACRRIICMEHSVAWLTEVTVE